ncbi:MAG: DUF4136 domain-containing protein [Leptothrix sp. (in: Bacteria)]|nr:DUF4136 domain-containing protein [Leptothrix sp. (in: b-proteobacteria)]
MQRRWLLAAVLAGVTVLAGCSTMRSVSSDISSFGEWPAGRAPGSYAFERLPSQQAQPEATSRLEAAAATGLARAGFKPAAAGQSPDVLVQVGARDSRYVVQPWNDALWWRGGFGYWRYGPWGSPHWGLSGYYDLPRYESQVALLIRDRASGKPLYETRAATESNTRADERTLAALFEAALMDFPQLGINPRRVVVDLPPAP